jgi:hypothetical protein
MNATPVLLTGGSLSARGAAMAARGAAPGRIEYYQLRSPAGVWLLRSVRDGTQIVPVYTAKQADAWFTTNIEEARWIAEVLNLMVVTVEAYE